MSKIDIGSYIPVIGTTWASELGTGEEGIVNELLKDVREVGENGVCYLIIEITEEHSPKPKSFKSAVKIDLPTSSLVCWDPPLETAPFPGWGEKFLQIAGDIISQLKVRYKPS